jgi:hypothetical protein
LREVCMRMNCRRLMEKDSARGCKLWGSWVMSAEKEGKLAAGVATGCGI